MSIRNSRASSVPFATSGSASAWYTDQPSLPWLRWKPIRSRPGPG
ncbi:hypothetical protein [Amycolatopsis sp. WAC 04182]|nr:hypothetical protein [Amycolatopsis sp. WAC 04182]